MPHFAGEAIVLSSLPHGEHGAVVRFLTFAAGLRAGYVAGGRGRAKRALIHPGNRVALQLQSKGAGHLATARLELAESRALLSFEPESAAILAYLAAASAATLAENVPQPRLAAALDALLGGLAAGLHGNRALAAVARYELLLLAECGFALDLSSCALGGDSADLAFVSPKSGRAVSAAQAAGRPWAGRLIPLPRFLLDGGEADAAAVAAALRLAGHFLHRHWPEAAAFRSLRERALGSGAATP